jgi:hypothetical protein
MTNRYAGVSERSLDAPGLGQKPRVYSEFLKSGERVEIPRFDAGIVGRSGLALEAFVALAVIAATLLNPLEVAISTARLIGAVLIETGVHTRLSYRLAEYLGETADGNMALPVAADGAAVGAGRAAGVGDAAAASAPH